MAGERYLSWNGIDVGEVKCGPDGKATIRIHDVFGELYRIGVIYTPAGDRGECTPQTTITITTSEGDKIIYGNNSEDFMDSPRRSIHGKFSSVSFSEGQQQMERYTNFGSILIEIENAGTNAILRNIYFLVRS